MKRFWFIGLLAAVTLSACTLRDLDSSAESFVYERDGMQMQFSLSVDATVPQTKMTTAITQFNQNEASFRGIKELYLIPFRESRAITMSDCRIAPNVELPQVGIAKAFGESANNGEFAGLVSNNNSHLYKNVFLRRGTASMLAYGQAIDEVVSVEPDSVAFKRRNGVLRKHGVEDADYPADITFTLEPFVTTAVEAEINGVVSGLCTYLNTIVAATVSQTGYEYRGSQKTWTYTWSTPTSYNNHGTLLTKFNFLTNDGLGFSAGTAGINQMLTSLYNSLYEIATDQSSTNSYYQSWYESNSRYAQEQRYYYVYQLARQIRTLINNGTYVTVTNANSANATVTLKSPYTNFPDRYGVPAGCVALIWNGTSFVQQTTATGSALAPIGSYCYPPSLWYMANSTIYTSDDATVAQEYKNTNTTWKSICDQYTFGRTVLPGVESVALKDPLQYGVGMLEVILNYAASAGGTANLLDSKGNAVSVNNSYFPLTGVVIGEQKHQEFNFTPTLGGTSLYVYDSDVNDSASPNTYIAGAGSLLTLKPVHTLVVQTEDGQDVHLALEFQNNSGADFYGANSNKIAAGSRFYLIAVLEYANAVNSTSETLSSVFVRDHVTKATFTVQSLAKAYNTIPELRDPQLEIGVTTLMEWVQVTPSEVPMY
ncbi:MAG: hypothetical protein J6X89_05745 [Bacteroidales bacterium]|nr:hypothetical protein [Bacteroidales bacterium]